MGPLWLDVTLDEDVSLRHLDGFIKQDKELSSCFLTGKCESSLGGKKTGMKVICDRWVTTTFKVINTYWAFISVPAICTVHKGKAVLFCDRNFKTVSPKR